MRRRFAVLLLSGAWALAAAPTLAHHSLQAEFDERKPVTLTGVVSKVEWINPHVYLYIDVPDGAGKVSTWAIETFPPNTLRRGGLTRDTLGLGQHVTMLAFQARKGPQLAFLRQITFDDGREIVIWLGDIAKASTR